MFHDDRQPLTESFDGRGAAEVSVAGSTGRGESAKQAGYVIHQTPVGSSSLVQCTFKILLVGDSGVGKSNLLRRFANNEFDSSTKATIGVDCVTRDVVVDSDGMVRVELWDTAGQERCARVSNSFFRSAKGVIVVYDVTSMDSVRSVPRWVAHARNFTDPNCVFQVVGNKTDLTNLREVSEGVAEEIAHSLDMRHFYASALNGDGVLTSFLQLILAMKCVYKAQEIVAAPALNEVERARLLKSIRPSSPRRSNPSTPVVSRASSQPQTGRFRCCGSS
jgi:small GTP-binding protein